jgi:hypothetical protein
MSLGDRAREVLRRLVTFAVTMAEKDRRRHRPVQKLWERSAESSADFIEMNMGTAVVYDEREPMWIHAMKSMPAKGMICEFGVFQGVSINFIADYLKRRGDTRTLYGFDSFEGLEEDWSGEALPAGFFDQGGKMPSVRDSVKLIKGWVQDTLPPFLKEKGAEGVALVHIDTDTYTPARCILENIRPFLVPGAVIIFDELVGYPNWQNHEYKALLETMEQSDYRFIGFTSRQAAIVFKG